MKPVFLIAIVAIAMIGVMVPSSFAEVIIVETAIGSGAPGCETSNACYLPQDITINAGDTVTWDNVDNAAHTITSGSPANGASGVFDSSLLMAKGVFSHTFDDAGYYDYFCMVHPWMIGSVTVEPTLNDEIPEQIIEQKNDEISNTINSSSKNTNILSKTFRTHHQQVTIEFDSWDLLPSNSEKLLVIFGKITENIEIGEQPDRFYKAPDFRFTLDNEIFRTKTDVKVNIFEPYQQIGYFGGVSPQVLPQGTPVFVAIQVPNNINQDTQIPLQLYYFHNIAISSVDASDIGNVSDLPFGVFQELLQVQQTEIENNAKQIISKLESGQIIQGIIEKSSNTEFKIIKVDFLNKSNKDLLILDVEVFNENESTFVGAGHNTFDIYAQKEFGLDELVDLIIDDGDYDTKYSGNWIEYSNTITEDAEILGTKIPGNKDWNVSCPFERKDIQAGITEKIRYCFEIPKNINAFIFEDSIFTRNAAQQNTWFSTNQPSSSEPSSSEPSSQTSSSQGGGCLIATATYGSELAPQVQQLRELRDNQLLQTESGAAFMSTFNDIYYSFSPMIADYERENPYFKETVKLAITPMISTLSLMENAESESEVLGIGISVIALNLGIYFGVPAIVIIGIRKRF